MNIGDERQALLLVQLGCGSGALMSMSIPDRGSSPARPSRGCSAGY
jgi:hypothetical protein